MSDYIQWNKTEILFTFISGIPSLLKFFNSERQTNASLRFLNKRSQQNIVSVVEDGGIGRNNSNSSHKTMYLKNNFFNGNYKH